MDEIVTKENLNIYTEGLKSVLNNMGQTLNYGSNILEIGLGVEVLKSGIKDIKDALEIPTAKLPTYIDYTINIVSNLDNDSVIDNVEILVNSSLYTSGDVVTISDLDPINVDAPNIEGYSKDITITLNTITVNYNTEIVSVEITTDLENTAADGVIVTIYGKDYTLDTTADNPEIGSINKIGYTWNITSKVPYGVPYTVSFGGGLLNFTVPLKVTKDWDDVLSKTITAQYTYVNQENGTFILDINGDLYTASDWTSALNAGKVDNDDVVGIAVLTLDRLFIVGTKYTNSIGNKNGTAITGIQTYSTSDAALLDFNGYNTTQIISSQYIGNGSYPSEILVVTSHFNKYGLIGYIPSLGELNIILNDSSFRSCFSACNKSLSITSRYFRTCSFKTTTSIYYFYTSTTPTISNVAINTGASYYYTLPFSLYAYKVSIQLNVLNGTNSNIRLRVTDDYGMKEITTDNNGKAELWLKGSVTILNNLYVFDLNLFTISNKSNLVLNASKELSINQGVDLGLPSGILWSPYNIGASFPEDFGQYFYFAGTKGYSTKDFAYLLGSIDYYNSKDVYFRENITPNSGHDAATENLGNLWRMPTQTEFQELLNNTDKIFDTLNGIKGIKFMNRSDHNVFIFLPCSGYSDLSGALSYCNSYGYYRTATLSSGTTNSIYSFSYSSSGTPSSSTGNNSSLYYLYSIRPVSDTSTLNLTTLTFQNLEGISLNGVLIKIIDLNREYNYILKNSNSIKESFSGECTIESSNATLSISSFTSGTSIIINTSPLFESVELLIKDKKDLNISNQKVYINNIEYKSNDNGIVLTNILYNTIYEISPANDIDGQICLQLLEFLASMPKREIVIKYEEDNLLYVDLGLPSGTKWAKSNIIRKDNVYQLTTKTSGYQSCYFNYRSVVGGIEGELIFGNSYYYGYTPSSSVRPDSINPVKHYFGENWDMPSIDQFNELKTYCDQEYIDEEDKKGWKFTSTINKQSIFIPSDGYIYLQLSSAPRNACTDYSNYNKNSATYFLLKDFYYYRPSSTTYYGPYYAHSSSSSNLIISSYSSENYRDYYHYPIRPVYTGVSNMKNSKNSKNHIKVKVTIDNTVYLGKIKYYYNYIKYYKEVTCDLNGEILLDINNNERITFFALGIEFDKSTFSLKDISEINLNGNSVDYVDMGFYSGTKWGKYNVGANESNPIGLYFSYGNAIGYDINSLYKIPSYSTTEGYLRSLSINSTIPIGKTYDGATATLGDAWKTPSYNNFTELINLSTKIETIVNGISGTLFKSKINGNEIFIPFTKSVSGNTLSTSYQNMLLTTNVSNSTSYFNTYNIKSSSGSSASCSYSYNIRPVYVKPDFKYGYIILNQNSFNPASKIVDMEGKTYIEGYNRPEVIDVIRRMSHRCRTSYDSGNYYMNVQFTDDENSKVLVSGSSPSYSEQYMYLPKFFTRATEITSVEDHTPLNGSTIWKIEFAININELFGNSSPATPPGNNWIPWGNILIGVYKSVINGTSVLSYWYDSFGALAATLLEISDASATIPYGTELKFSTHNIMTILFYAYYGHTDSLKICGYGPSSSSKVIGATLGLGMTDTKLSDNVNYVNFWGLENWWGGYPEYLTGLGYQSYKPYDSEHSVSITNGAAMSGYFSKFVISNYLYCIPLSSTISYSSDLGYCDLLNISSYSAYIRSGSNDKSAGISYITYYSSDYKSSTVYRLLYTGTMKLI